MLPSSTTKMLNKEEEQVKKDEPVKPKSNLKPRWIWQKKVGPPLEAPLMEAPPQESSSSRANQGRTHAFLWPKVSMGHEMASFQQ